MTLVRAEQLKKALVPMVFTPSGIVRFANLEHWAKAAYPIEVTLVGITTVTNAPQFKKPFG